MSREILETLVSSVEDSVNLLNKFIEVCPDDVWNDKAGAWPVWQHVAHVPSGTDFFMPGQDVPIPAPLTPELVQFKAVGDVKVDKKVLSDYIVATQAKFKAFAATISDADLTKPNQKCHAVGLEWNVGKTLAALAGHVMYHLGHCDACLRAKGLPGVF
ncbi:MAG: DinB family protein [Deltaproteobacteria bacterium]|jgi:hypothetical protein|nr:DinB family protein [Deltaproteobacteria bacterium]